MIEALVRAGHRYTHIRWHVDCSCHQNCKLQLSSSRGLMSSQQLNFRFQFDAVVMP